MVAGVWHGGRMQVVWQTLGVGQTVPPPSSMLGWPPMEEPTVRKLMKVEYKSLKPGRAAPGIGWRQLSHVEPSQVQAGCAFQRRPGKLLVA